jgi:lysophospholipase L1-like esterase
MLSQIIQDVSSSFAEAEFIDLRKTIIPLLAKKTISPYVPKSSLRMLLDALFVKKPEEMEKRAAERGLTLTLDGVHLNSAGAGLVAGFFASKIEEYCRRPTAS